MISVAEALARCLALVGPLPSETIPLRHAAGRMMAAPVTAQMTQPPFDAAAMDGYALGSLAGRYFVVGESAAGHGWDGTLGPGEAVRIFTGAPLPAGAGARGEGGGA